MQGTFHDRMAASEQPNHSLLVEYHTTRTVRTSTASSNGLLGCARMLPWFEDVGPLCSVRGTVVVSLVVEAIFLLLVLGGTQGLVAAVLDRRLLSTFFCRLLFAVFVVEVALTVVDLELVSAGLRHSLQLLLLDSSPLNFSGGFILLFFGERIVLLILVVLPLVSIMECQRMWCIGATVVKANAQVLRNCLFVKDSSPHCYVYMLSHAVAKAMVLVM